MICYKCKHLEEDHSESISYPTQHICWECFTGTYPFPWQNKSYHEFQLDNLDLIEKLAKERNLI